MERNFPGKATRQGRSIPGSSSRRTVQLHTTLCSLTAAVALAGCSNDAPKDAGLPTPTHGKVTTFSLARVSTAHDLTDAADPYSSLQPASDQSGNVYLATNFGRKADILKVTPRGTVSKFALIPAYGGGGSIAIAGNGGLLVGSGTDLFRVDRHGTYSSVDTPRFKHPRPIGAQPDGSMIVQDNDALWSLKGTRKTKLYTYPKESGKPSTAVDATGTIYTDTGSTLKDMLVLAPGHKPRALHVHGVLPGTKTPISSQTAITVAPAPGGGLYAQANTAPTSGESKFAYIVRVRPSGAATVLARGTMDSSNPGCKTGKQYPALNTPCAMPWYVVQSGNRLLAMGTGTTYYTPAFALPTGSAKD